MTGILNQIFRKTGFLLGIIMVFSQKCHPYSPNGWGCLSIENDPLSETEYKKNTCQKVQLC